MKEGWEYKKLADVALYSIGLTYKPSDVSEEGTIVLRSSNIQNDKLDLNDIVKVNCPIKESLYVQKDDILMCSRNGSAKLVGKVALIPEIEERMTYGTFMMVIRSIYNPYLFYYFKSDNFRSQIKHGEANMINQITRYMLDDVYLYIPPLSEQQSIVDYLDSAFAKIDAMKANAEKALNEAKALFQASLKEMLEPKEGWEEKHLKDIAQYSIGLTYKPTNVCDDGTIVLRSSNIQEGKLDLRDIVRVNASIKDNLYVRSGDVLMCSRNGSARLVGKVCIIPELKEKMTYGTFMMVIRSAYNPLLYHYFDTGLFRNQIKHGEANMINQITRYMLDEVKLNLPPINEQNSIVATLDSLKSKVDRLQENYDKISQECDALKQAILRQIFE